MKEIRIKIEEEDYEYLLFLAKEAKTTPNNILQQFARDLTLSDHSGGSDERDLAQSWYYRSIYNF